MREPPAAASSETERGEREIESRACCRSRARRRNPQIGRGGEAGKKLKAQQFLGRRAEIHVRSI